MHIEKAGETAVSNILATAVLWKTLNNLTRRLLIVRGFSVRMMSEWVEIHIGARRKGKTRSNAA
jgi:hypothetical protein